MKKIIIMFCCLIITFYTTVVVATNESVVSKKGDEFLKSSLSKWEEVGNKSAFETVGEFFQKGFPALSKNDSNRLIINIIIFSCIANVGIVIYILKQDNNKEDTILRPKKHSYHSIDKERSKQILITIKTKHPNFDEKLFLRKSELLFKNYCEQNEIEKGMEHHIEKIKIKNWGFIKYFTDDTKEKVVVLLNVKMIEFWTNNTKAVIKGNKKTMNNLWYKSTFIIGVENISVENMVRMR